MTRLIRVTEPQARAMLNLMRFGETPTVLDRHEKKSLTHLAERLRWALEDKPIHPVTRDLDRLEDALLSARSRQFREFIRTRLRDLLSVALLWRGAEELPSEIAAPLLVLDRAGDASWVIEVLDKCGAHGLLVRLPGEEVEADEDDEGGSQ